VRVSSRRQTAVFKSNCVRVAQAPCRLTWVVTLCLLAWCACRLWAQAAVGGAQEVNAGSNQPSQIAFLAFLAASNVL
jgi:hypothetical protein